MFNHPKTLIISLLCGILGSLIWLWFWLKEDEKNYEPRGVLIFCFILGMAGVILVLPIEKFIQGIIASHDLRTILWAAAEEMVKFFAVMIVVYRTKYTSQPIDWPIYLITTALGFAALENTLFLFKPLSLNQATVGLMTSNLRFLGATLLHTVSSGIIGVSLGLSFFEREWIRKLYVLIAIIVAITLHSVFNFFIMKNNGSNFFTVFSFLWVVTIIIMLLFEKLRRMSGE
jgi:RsiW-degrading membrane proteinase PrsW (M82 family)